jgi:hypothetical protein
VRDILLGWMSEKGGLCDREGVMVQKEAGGAERVTLSFSFFPSFPFSRTDHGLKPNLNVTWAVSSTMQA